MKRLLVILSILLIVSICTHSAKPTLRSLYHRFVNWLAMQTTKKSSPLESNESQLKSTDVVATALAHDTLEEKEEDINEPIDAENAKLQPQIADTTVSQEIIPYEPHRHSQAIVRYKPAAKSKELISGTHTDIDEFLKEVPSRLQVDYIASLRSFSRIIHTFVLIEQKGTLEQKQIAADIIIDNRMQIKNHIANSVTLMMQDVQFQDGLNHVVVACASGVTMGTFMVSLWQAISQETFGPQLLEKIGKPVDNYALLSKLGLSCAETGAAQLIALMGKHREPNVIDNLIARTILYAGSTGFSPLQSALLLLSNEISEVVQNIIENQGGVPALLQKIDMKDIIIGRIEKHDIQNIQSSQIARFSQFGFQVFTNMPDSWKSIAFLVTKKALTAAVVGGLFYLCGLGFSGEVTQAMTFIEMGWQMGTVMTYAAMRGGLQGFLEYILVGTGRAGTLAKTGVAGLLRGVQRLLSGQAMWALTEGIAQGAYEVSVTAAQEVIKSAGETLIAQLGGPMQALKTITGEIKEGVVHQAEKRYNQMEKEFEKIQKTSLGQAAGGASQVVRSWISGISNRIEKGIAKVITLDVDSSKVAEGVYI